MSRLKKRFRKSKSVSDGVHVPATAQSNGVPTDATDTKSIDIRHEIQTLSESLHQLNPRTDTYATQFIEQLLAFADRVQTSDIHMQPASDGFSLSFRNNGVLSSIGQFSGGSSSTIVSRLKVVSDLLTYQNEVPQEGRISEGRVDGEVRVSTYPTLHGERAVLRFFGHTGDYQHLSELGHTPEVTEAIQNSIAETSGAMIVSGPAGSGKSTTLFACLRELVADTGGNRALLTIEDPIEVPIPGVAQSQVNAAAGFDLHTGLKSLLRQDPEVIMIGEIRDPTTADIAIQASLTGQLMLTSFHADSASTAISRLLNLGVEPYLLRSGLIGVLSQRLLRVLCHCRIESKSEKDFFGLPIERCWLPGSCDQCNQSGYRGRVITSEFLSLKDSALADQLIDNRDSRAIYRIAVENGMKSMWERATELVREGKTSPAEVRRVLGIAMRI